MTADAKNAPMGRKTDVMELQCTLTVQQARALARLCRGIGWNDVRGIASNDDEAWEMLAACDVVRDGLAHEGFSAA